MVIDPDPALSERVYAASAAKYGMGSHSIEGSHAGRPRVAFAWTESGLTQIATRWLFGDG